MKKAKYQKLETDLEKALENHKKAKSFPEEVEAWKGVKAAYKPLKDELITHRAQVRNTIKGK
jgi:hypothetical protein